MRRMALGLLTREGPDLPKPAEAMRHAVTQLWSSRMVPPSRRVIGCAADPPTESDALAASPPVPRPQAS